MTVSFEIEGYEMLALNGGPAFQFTPAISFMMQCTSTVEVEELWGKLIDGGQALMPLDTYPFSDRYGWLSDKYGVSWQIIYAKDGGPRRIIPSLLFVGDKAGKAREAMNLYTSVFPESALGTIVEYGEGQAAEPAGNVMYGEFHLFGQPFSAMDSSMKEHIFTFNESISFIVNCKNQAEIDEYWEKLSAVPEAEMCGWLKDAFGVSWQISPEGWEKMWTEADPEKRERAMAAMMQMKKLDIATLEAA